MEEAIYEAKFSKRTDMDIPIELDLSPYDVETKKFIILSIAYAKKSKSDIVIVKDRHHIRSRIHVTLGIFFGEFKNAFVRLALKSEDFLILPMCEHSNFSLEISASYNMARESSWL